GDLHLDTECVLFGNIAEAATRPGVPANLIQAAVVLGVTALAVVLFFKELLVSAFDPGLARSLGIRAGWVHYLTMGWLSVVTVTAFEAVGSILVVAMLIIPGATALLLTDRLGKALALTVAHTFASAVAGYHLGLWLDSNVPAAMVVAGLGFFGFAWLFAPRQGLLSLWIHRRRLRRDIAANEGEAAM
ncbi:MAG: metal ABC transporter permease, partial [Verrucomicrobiae bacterium]|nr:metal ABC transporter permease [Verrucomicrobiae bacterium]